jgi:2-phospho-L-lactate/phosphoenolpyruvate guanylyltransferase
MPAVTAIVPLKGLAAAKSRLAPALAPERRQQLAVTMLEHVLAVCRAAPSVEAVLVVAGDTMGAEVAGAAGARVVRQVGTGLPAALELADAALEGAAATLVVAADLPLLSPEDVEAVCAAGAVGPAVVVAPTRDGGTGGLLRRPGGVIPTAFGPGSASAHRRLAAAAGILPSVVDRDGFALDVDTAGQLRAAAQRTPALLPYAG